MSSPPSGALLETQITVSVLSLCWEVGQTQGLGLPGLGGLVLRTPGPWFSIVLWISLLESVWPGIPYEKQTRAALDSLSLPCLGGLSRAVSGLRRQRGLSSKCHVAHEDTLSQVGKSRGLPGETGS